MNRREIKIATVVGARPQFVKAAMVSKAIASYCGSISITEEILHTGQHYDPGMNEVFFQELEIPAPAVNLGVGSGSHGEMTAKMLAGIERYLLRQKPDVLLVYGDTNSTLAGALAASKLHIPIAHVEAGLRSYNRQMPEEVNRILTDHVSDLLFCPTMSAVRTLASEGITAGVSHVGDVMYDAALHYGLRARNESAVLDRLGILPREYYLTTVHRAENTDSQDRFAEIFRALVELSTRHTVIFPVHPRTRSLVERAREAHQAANVRLIDPVPFLDMIRLEQSARLILTDSGGVQKEAYFHGVPCITLRDETEWQETVEAGWNQLTGADSRTILAGAARACPGRSISDYGDGGASRLIVSSIVEHISCAPRTCYAA